jgi:hypothetical protein
MLLKILKNNCEKLPFTTNILAQPQKYGLWPISHARMGSSPTANGWAGQSAHGRNLPGLLSARLAA